MRTHLRFASLLTLSIAVIGCNGSRSDDVSSSPARGGNGTVEAVPAIEGDPADVVGQLKQVAKNVKLDGNGFVNLGRSSSDLSKGEMSDLMELIAAFGAKHGVVFKDTATPSFENPNTERSPGAFREGGGVVVNLRARA